MIALISVSIAATFNLYSWVRLSIAVLLAETLPLRTESWLLIPSILKVFASTNFLICASAAIYPLVRSATAVERSAGVTKSRSSILLFIVSMLDSREAIRDLSRASWVLRATISLALFSEAFLTPSSALLRDAIIPS